MQRLEDFVTNQIGLPVSGATATVRIANATPGTGALATIYSNDGVTTTANPLTTDSRGKFAFYAPSGVYDITISGTGITTYIRAAVTLAPYNGTLLASDFSGADWAAKIASAVATLPVGGGTVFVPSFLAASPATTALTISANNVKVIFDAGIFTTSGAILVTGNNSGIVGQGYQTQISYTGGVTNSVLQFNTTNSSTYQTGVYLENITVKGNGNVTHSVAFYRPTEVYAKHVSVGNTNTTSGDGFYVWNGVANNWDNISCNAQGGALGVPKNGIVFDGTNVGDSTTTSTVSTPTAEYCTGIGLYLKQAQNLMITGMQVSANATNIQLDAGSFENVIGGLSEYVSGYTTNNLLVYGSYNSFNNLTLNDSSGGTGSITRVFSGASGNTFNTSWITGALTLDSGSAATTLLGTITQTLTVTDNAKDTHYLSGGSDTGYPSERSTVVPIQQLTTPALANAGISAEPVLDLWSGWFAANGATKVISPTKFTTGKAWRAYFDGEWLATGSPVQQIPQKIELTESDNVVTLFGGGTLTFTVNGSGLFQMVSTATYLGFVGRIVFMPNKSALTTTTDSVSFRRRIASKGFYALGIANNVDIIKANRFTDSSPTGNFLNFKSFDDSLSLFSVDVNGLIHVQSGAPMRTGNAGDSFYLDLGSISFRDGNGSNGGSAIFTGTMVPGFVNQAGGIGTNALPFPFLYIGAAATNNIKVTGTGTSARTLTLPDATDTLVGKATTDVFTNKTLDTAGTGNVLKINGTQVSAVTGSGSSVVLATAPTLSALTVTGKITSYNGVSTAGIGTAPVYGSIALTAQTATIAATSLYASAPAGLYRVTFYCKTTTAGSAGTVTVTIAWNDGTAISTTSATASLASTTSTGLVTGTVIVKSAASQNITYATTVASAAGSPQYSLTATIEQVQ